MKANAKKGLAAMLVALVLSEFIIRLLGYKPGHWGKFEGFYPVDSLILAKNFVTDEYGIYKFGPWVTDSLKKEKHFNWRSATLKSDEAKSALKVSDNITYVYATYKKLELQGKEDFNIIARMLFRIMLEENENWDTQFTRVYENITQKASPNNLEKAILNYVSNPFNSEGFRGIEHEVHDTSATRILLIGDSFVYGMTASPLFNSFADLLLARGYEVYNTGIPAADPAQYAAMARKYIPSLKPDLVVVCFFEGNDLMWFPKSATQDKPHEHVTNAGFFESYPLGEYLTPSQAYDYYLSLIQIPEQNLFDKICAKTSICSLIWGILLKHDILEHPGLSEYYSFRAFEEDAAIAVTKPYFNIIDSICFEFKIPLVNIVIPDLEHVEGDQVKINKIRADKLFEGKYYNPATIFTLDDFGKKDRHFNNSGSLKFANYIDSVIQLQGYH